MLLMRQEQGYDVPALRNRVEVEPKLLYYRKIFAQLADSRQYTQSGTPLPIPISEYTAYFEAFYIDSLEERERIFTFVRAQDRTYVDFMLEKAKTAAESDKKSKRAVSRK